MADKVTPEQFVAPSSHSFSTLQATLVHTLDTEMGWRNLLQGNGYAADLKADDFPTVESIRQRWQEEERAMWVYINSLTDEDLVGIIRYPGDPGKMRQRI